MAGILCAYFLQEKGVDYTLVEGRRICSGVTKNTTAKITAQHGLIYGKLLKQNGAEQAGMYLEANQRAAVLTEQGRAGTSSMVADGGVRIWDVC